MKAFSTRLSGSGFRVDKRQNICCETILYYHEWEIAPALQASTQGRGGAPVMGLQGLHAYLSFRTLSAATTATGSSRIGS
jgi:hypothetical protein